MNWIQEHNRNTKMVAAYKEGYTLYQVADMFACSRTTAYKIIKEAAAQGLVTMRPKGRPRGSDRNNMNEATAVSMRERGATYQQIGDMLGVSRQRAHQIVQRAGEEARRG